MIVCKPRIEAQGYANRGQVTQNVECMAGWVLLTRYRGIGRGMGSPHLPTRMPIETRHLRESLVT